MTVRIVDNGMVSKAGHHYSFNKRLVAADPTIVAYGFRNMEQAIKEEGWSKGLFSHWLYVRTSGHQVTWMMDDFISLSETFAHDMTAFEYEDGDTLLLHTANAPVLYGLARWLEKKNPKVKIRIILGLPGMVDENGAATQWFPFYLKAVNELKRWRGDIKYGTHTEWLIGEGTMLGITPSVVPPAAMNFTDPKAPLMYGEQPVFGFLGHANGVKGLPLLYQAAELDKDGVYLCQTNPKAPIELPNVETIQGELSEKEYIAALSRMDVVVLPYQRSYYKGHISGVFLESINSGRPVIIPRDTWLEYEAKRQEIGYETFDSGSASSLLLAIQAMRKNWRENYSKSINAVDKIRQKYSVERYLQWVKN